MPETKNRSLAFNHLAILGIEKLRPYVPKRGTQDKVPTVTTVTGKPGGAKAVSTTQAKR